MARIDERVIRMTHQHRQHVSRSIGVAGGRRKPAAICGALDGRWIDVLITDRSMAEPLLKAPAESERRPLKRRKETAPA